MGKYEKEYLKIAMPSAAEGIFMILLSSADLIMVGTLGTESIAAVSIFVQIKMILLCIARSMATAVMVLTARKAGMGKEQEAKGVLRQSLPAMILFLCAIHVFFFLFIEKILWLAGADAAYLARAVIYGRIALCAVFLSSISAVLQAALMGFGKTGIVMKTNVAGNITNVLMNGILILGMGPFPAFGVKGAGIAALTGAAVTLSYTGYTLRKRGILQGRGKWLPERNYLKEFFPVFGGVFLEQGSERIGMVLYSRMAAGLGTVPFVVHSICMNVCDIYYNFAQGLGKASMVLAGRSEGKRSREDWEAYLKSGIKISLIFSAVSFLICFIFRDTILSFYTRDKAVAEIGSIIMIFVAAVSFPEAHAMICAGVLRGSGKTGQVALYSFISITVIRPLLTAFLIYRMNLGVYGAWISLAFDQTMRAVCSSIFLKRLKLSCFDRNPSDWYNVVVDKPGTAESEADGLLK